MERNRTHTGSIPLRKMGTILLAFMMMLTAMLPMMTEEASAFSGKKGSTYTTHKGSQIRYGSGDGGYSNTLTTDLGDSLGSRYSYCVQPDRRSPEAGKATVDKVLEDDLDTGKWNGIRNICYYSPSYPGYEKNVKGVWKEFYTGDANKDWGIAHLALSYVYAGRPADLPTWGGTHASSLGDVWTKAKKLGDAMYKDGTFRDEAVPDGFKVFVCFQGGVQDMLVGYLNTGYLKLHKVSANESLSKDNNCYSLKGAKYGVYDSDGKKVDELVTDEKGESQKIELPVGHYTIKELEAAKGYAIETISDKDSKVTINSEETTTFKTSDKPQNDPFAVVLQKIDRETGKPHAIGGASLEGAQFQVVYYDDFYTSPSEAKKSDKKKTWVLKTDKDGEIYAPQSAQDMETYFVSGDEFYKTADGKLNTFALGSYIITEIKAPEGYEKNETPQLAVVKGNGSKTETVKSYNMLTSKDANVKEPAKRGDLEFLKKDIGEDRLANCVFKITSKSTGESHIVVTDPNGKFTSKGTVNTDTVNKNDDALSKDGTLDESKLSYKNKVWFGMDKEGNVTKPDSKLRPFVYDEYTIKELPCEANKNKNLISTTAFVYEDGYVCDLGTITDADIGTKLNDRNGHKMVLEGEDTSLVDEVSYEKLKTGHKFVAECTIMDKETGEPLKVDDKVVTGSQEFTTRSNKGSVDVNMTFNTKGLAGKNLVAFEEIYELNEDGSKGDLVATHKDITDDGQTVKVIKVSYNMYKIRTTDAPEANDPAGKYGFAKGEKVDYDVIVENTGDLDLTMNVTDNFNNKGYFSDPTVKKVTGAAWNNQGKKLRAANITVKAGETAKVTFTTTVTNAPVKLADTAKDSDSKYKADENAEEKDCNMKDQTNEPADDGWTNTARTYDVTYTIEGKDSTIPEKTDIAQTPIRPNPEIGTYLTADAKKKVIASKKTKFVDTVSYKDLTPGNTYILECVLMVKDTKDPMVEHGEKVTGTATFVPEKSTGKQEVEFTVNTTGMEGKELVAFETCYNTKTEENSDTPEKNRVVATHKDINDEAQMVLIRNPKDEVIPPLTGDQRNLLIYGGALIICVVAGAAYYKTRKKKASSNK